MPARRAIRMRVVLTPAQDWKPLSEYNRSGAM
jgi:hypothetical protein